MEGSGLGLDGTSLLIPHFTSGIEENKSENGRCPNRNSNWKLLQGYCCTKLLISAFETSINNLTPGYVKKIFSVKIVTSLCRHSSTYVISDSKNFEKVKKMKQLFETHAEFCHTDMKAQ